MKTPITLFAHLLLILILFSCSGDSTDNTDDNTDLENPQEELLADFEMNPVCCPPASATGLYFDRVEIQFTNLSTGEGLQYEWSFGSTEKSPNETFPLTPGYTEITRTIGLTVTDANGASAYVEKSIVLPMLVPFGTMTFDGVECDINVIGHPTSYSIYGRAPTYGSVYNNISDSYNTYRLSFLSGTLDYNECDFPFIIEDSLVIRFGGGSPTQTTGMTQTGNFNVTDSSKFYLSYGNHSWKTFDNDGGVSSGATTIAGMDEGYNMIVALDLTGQVRNVGTGEIKDFVIDLNWIAHECYYNYSAFVCDGQPGW
jgi:hypothetical protein